jgi:RNA polymerase sigma-70 factor (ECF subfamily)
MDEKLINEAIAGSKEAFCSLYGEYKDKLYRYALYRLGDPSDAEDAVSECVLAAWQGLPGLRKPEAFGSWIFRILHACCAKRIKDSIRLRENMQRIYTEGGSGPSDAGSSQASLSVELTEALSQLNEEERNIVLLSVLGDLTSREISEITSLTPGAVRSKLSRSLAKMREYLS